MRATHSFSVTLLLLLQMAAAAAAAATKVVKPTESKDLPSHTQGNKTFVFLESGFISADLHCTLIWETLGPLLDAHCGPVTGHTNINVTAKVMTVYRKGQKAKTGKRIQGLVFTKTPLSGRDALIGFAKGNAHVSPDLAMATLADRWVVELQITHLNAKDTPVRPSTCAVCAIYRSVNTFKAASETKGMLNSQGETVEFTPAAAAAAAAAGAAANSAAP
jgi:hypothetical protein